MTHDLLSGFWPVVANPEPDELISSWLHRLAFGNGLPPRTFGPALDLGSGAWSGKLDLALPAIVRDRLVRCTGLASGAVDGMTLAGVGARSLLLPMRADLSPAGGASASRVAAILSALSGRRRATLFPEGMAPGDDDRLRASREPPARPLPMEGMARSIRRRCGRENDCAACGFNLASAKAPRLGAGARRAAAILAALGRRVTDADAAVVDAILALPAKLDPLLAAALTALPTSERARALPAMARDIDRLSAAATNKGAGRERSAERMPAAPQASLPALLEAYATVRRRRAAASQGIGSVRSPSP